MRKKILTVVVVVFLTYFIASKPANAAVVVKRLANGVADIGTGFGTFFTNLVS
jgi:hypothetical protein